MYIKLIAKPPRLKRKLRQSQGADQRPQGDYAENQRVCAELRS
jgi:hypothetical protein